jgi:hypothetical protein
MDNVLLARAMITGSLPVTLATDLPVTYCHDLGKVAYLEKTYDVSVAIHHRRKRGHRHLLVHGAERNIQGVFETRR